MGKPNQYKAQDFIDAIPTSGGIITTIAERVGCAWNTAYKYIHEYATIKAAYDDECERVTDMAESVLIHNIRLAAKKQREKEGGPVDSADAKWYLTRKGKSRGYVERQEVTGKDGDTITFRVVRE